MRRVVLVLASLVAAIVLLVVGDAPPEKVAAAPKPNIVFILADDMRKDDLKYMPKTRALLGTQGMSFSNAFVSNPLCCPSRATIMRGQYAHNTGVWTNAQNPSLGGWQTYRRHGNERDNVATRLDAAGYRTALIGRYLNGYKNTTYIPPGWDYWFHYWGGYFNYGVSDNGTIRRFGARASDYNTDVLRRETQTFIDASAARGNPFFAYVAPFAPHKPAIPAPRDEHAYDGVKAPRSPSFSERDVSDKPPWIRRLSRLSDGERAAIDSWHEKRVESLQAVDDLVAAVIGELRDAGVLSNTYVFFTSDNGWHHGEHRIERGKARAYEEDIRVPLLVRGPGVRAGSMTNKLVLNTDYLPTFTDLVGANNPPYVDGRSMRPVLRGTATSWRTAILIEAKDTPEGGATPAFKGIRTAAGIKYVEYAGGKKERYNLRRDPYELRNIKSVRDRLPSRLKALKDCKRAGCRAAENRAP